jgi:Domain of unknown function (DUF6249)
MRSGSSGDFFFFAIVFGLVPISIMITVVLVQRFRTQERLRAIEKGEPLPSEPAPRLLSQEERTAGFRVAGIVCVAVGLGLLVLFTSLAETLPPEQNFPKGVIAVSAVPFFLGLGFLLEYRMRRKEMEARGRSDSGAGSR